MPGLTGRTAFSNAKKIVTRMFELSTDMSVAEAAAKYNYPASDEAETVKLFIGLVRDIAKEVGVRETTRSHATALLKAMRCITLLRMGGSGTNTVYILHYIPTDEQFDEYRNDRDATSSRIAPNAMQRYENELAIVRIQQRDFRLALEQQDKVIEELVYRVRMLEENGGTDVRGSKTLS